MPPDAITFAVRHQSKTFVFDSLAPQAEHALKK